MNRRLLPLVAIAMSAALVHPLVRAQTIQPSPRWYVGGNVGVTDFGSCPSFASCDTKDRGYRVFGGYQFHPIVGVEVGYAHLGETSASVAGLRATTKAAGLTVQAVASWPVFNRVSVFGKLGVILGESRIDGALGSREDRGLELATGIGARYAITNTIDVSAEWDRYRFKVVERGRGDVDMISIGVRVKF